MMFLSCQNLKSMAHYSAKPICIKLRVSKQLAMCLCLIALVASLAVWVLPWVWAMLLSAAIWLSAIYAMRLHVLKHAAHAVVQIDVNRRGEWCVLLANGQQQSVSLSGHSVVSPYVVVLLFQVKKTSRRLSVVILPDAADAESLRQLRVWLRWAWPSME
jgi:toxin CptA